MTVLPKGHIIDILESEARKLVARAVISKSNTTINPERGTIRDIRDGQLLGYHNRDWVEPPNALGWWPWPKRIRV